MSKKHIIVKEADARRLDEVGATMDDSNNRVPYADIISVVLDEYVESKGELQEPAQ